MKRCLKLPPPLTLGETLIGQRDLAGQQVEAETAEDAAERRDGDETVGGARLRGGGGEEGHPSEFIRRLMGFHDFKTNFHDQTFLKMSYLK